MTTGTSVPLSRNRDFQILWTGQAVSMLGSGVTQVAYPLLTLALTGSAAYAGLVVTIETVVYLAATLPAGVIADRFDRRAIMVGSDLVRAVLLGGLGALVLSGHATVWLVVTVAGLASVFDGLFLPASQGAAKQIVPPEQMSTASAFAHSRAGVAMVAGPPLGGWLFTVGRAVPFLADAVSYLLSGISLLFIRTRFQKDRTATAEPVWKGATAGFRFILRTPILRSMMGWAILINIVMAGVPIIMIADADERGADDRVIGLMLTITGVGMLAGGLLAPLILRLIKPSPLLYATVWTMPPCLAAMVFLPWPLALGAAFGLTVLLVAPLNALFAGYLAVMTTDAMQGRVMAALAFTVQGLRPLGPIALGVVFDRAGGSWAFAIGAVLAALAALFSLDKSVRHLPAQEELAAE